MEYIFTSSKINSSVNDYKLSKNTSEFTKSLENKSFITNKTSLVLNVFFDIYNQVEQKSIRKIITSWNKRNEISDKRGIYRFKEEKTISEKLINFELILS